MEKFFRHRLVLLAIILGISLGVGGGMAFLGFDYSPQYAFQSQSPKFKLLEKYQGIFGKTDHLIPIIFEGDGLFTEPGLSYIRTLTEKIDQLAQFKARGLVDHFPEQTAPGELKKQALASPWLRRMYISEEGDALCVFAELDHDIEKIEVVQKEVENLEKVLHANPPPEGIEYHLSGVPYIRVQIVKMLIHDQMFFLPICCLLFALVLFFLFRRLSLIFIPFGALSLAVIWTLGIMGWVGRPIDIINNVLPVLIFTIGISDAIHLLCRYLVEYKRLGDQEQALGLTTKHLALACFFTSFTTAVGFVSLMVAEIDILKYFGLYAAIGVILAYFLTIILLPLTLSYTSPIDGPTPGGSTWGLDWLGSQVIRHPIAVLIFTAALLAGAGYYASKVEVDNYLLESFSPDDPAYIAGRKAEEKMGGLLSMAVLYQWTDDHALDRATLISMDKLAHHLKKHPGVRYVITPADVIREAEIQFQKMAGLSPPPLKKMEIPRDPQRLQLLQDQIVKFRPDVWNQLVRSDKNAARVLVFTTDLGGKEYALLEDDLQSEVDGEKLEGVDLAITGICSVAYLGIQAVLSDLKNSLLLAFVIIFIAMTILFRSVKVGLISLVPNIAPLTLAWGFLGLYGLHLQTTTAFVFPIALGLAVDDTIHFLIRYGEACGKGKSVEDALAETFHESGRAILFTSLLLGLGFASMLLTTFPITFRFALLMEIVIVGAIVGDLLLLPALLVLFQIRFVPRKHSPSPDNSAGEEVQHS